MNELWKENWKEVVKVVAIIVVFSFIAVIISSWLKTEIVQQKVESLGILGPLIIIIYIAASHVIAPLTGFPGTVAALSVYGLVKGWLLIYIASLISATLNFYIARILGRNWVIKLSGKDSVKKIDRFIDIMGTRLLIIARLFGSPLYEFISYAAGFTNMSFKKYFAITALVSPITGTIITVYAYWSLDSPLKLSIFLFVMILMGVIFTWYTVWLYLRTAPKKE